MPHIYEYPFRPLNRILPNPTYAQFEMIADRIEAHVVSTKPHRYGARSDDWMGEFGNISDQQYEWVKEFIKREAWDIWKIAPRLSKPALYRWIATIINMDYQYEGDQRISFVLRSPPPVAPPTHIKFPATLCNWDD